MSAIWNPSDKSSGMVLSNDYRTARNDSYLSWGGVRSIVSKSSGKWYWEIEIDEYTNYQSVGIGTSSHSFSIGVGYNTTAGYGYWYNGNKVHNDTGSSFGSSFAPGDIIGIALDLDNGKIWFAKNNSWQDSGDPGAGTDEAFSGISGTFYPIYCNKGEDPTATAAFISDDQNYSPPSGFQAFTSVEDVFDGKAKVILSTSDQFDGTAVICPSIIEFDGKAYLYKVITGLFDGKAFVDRFVVDTFDGRGHVVISTTGNFDGKARIKDSATNLFDGTLFLYPARDLFDGKVWIKELINGDIDLPSLDIEGYTGGVGDVVLPCLDYEGTLTVGIDAQGNVTLPALGVVSFTGANCRYDLPSIQVSGTSIVGTVANGDIVLPIFGVEGQAFTDAIVRGNVDLPLLSISGSSSTGAIAIGEALLPSLGINATAKVGTISNGAITLPCLVIAGTGIHIPTGVGDITLPMLTVNATASHLADPRDGCHVLRHHRWKII